MVSSSTPGTGQVKLLLAVDLGVRTGLALYTGDGRLQWCRSHNFGTAERLRRGARRLLGELAGLELVVLEGGGHLAAIWGKEAAWRNIPTRVIGADVWREVLLIPAERRNSDIAKRSAGLLARRVISWSESPQPPSLRHDAAEAVLIGLWGVWMLGWISRPPLDLLR